MDLFSDKVICLSFLFFYILIVLPVCVLELDWIFICMKILIFIVLVVLCKCLTLLLVILGVLFVNLFSGIY